MRRARQQLRGRSGEAGTRFFFGGGSRRRFLSTTGPIQPKLRIGRPNDILEREADDAAAAFVNGDASLQRTCRESSPGQRLSRDADASPRAANDTGARQAANAVSGGGSALPDTIWRPFEQLFDRDLSDVRIHNDRGADAAARVIGAKAYTIGSHIAFAQGEYAPTTPTGRHLLAHELTHTVQQQRDATVRRYYTEDCSESDRAIVRRATGRAVSILRKAIARLTARPPSATTRTHFANHFGRFNGMRRDFVVLNYRKDLGILLGDDLQFECEEECDSDDRAYTFWIFGDVHLCPNWMRDRNLTEQAETVIHEIHHWDPVRGHLDLGYHRNARDNDVSWGVSMYNADAYSELAQDLFEQP